MADQPLANNIFLPEPLYRRDKKGIKAARPDIILDDESLPIDVMQDFIFAEIGGQEILDISRSDLINSPLNLSYSPTPGTGANFIQEDTISFTDGTQNIFGSFSYLLDAFSPTDENTVVVQANNTSKVVSLKTKEIPSTASIEIEFLTNMTIEDDIIFRGI
jgi:hypothetical protein